MTATENPFFETWNTPFGAPPFSRIKPEHFVPAYERAFAEHEAEIATIAGQKEPPTFDNTIIALENAGRALAARRRHLRPALSAPTATTRCWPSSATSRPAPRRTGTRCG